MYRELRRLQRLPHDLPDATLVGQRPGLGAEDPGLASVTEVLIRCDFLLCRIRRLRSRRRGALGCVHFRRGAHCRTRQRQLACVFDRLPSASLARWVPHRPVSSTVFAAPCAPATTVAAPRRRTSRGSVDTSSSTASEIQSTWARR